MSIFRNRVRNLRLCVMSLFRKWRLSRLTVENSQCYARSKQINMLKHNKWDWQKASWDVERAWSKMNLKKITGFYLYLRLNVRRFTFSVQQWKRKKKVWGWGYCIHYIKLTRKKNHAESIDYDILLTHTHWVKI